MTTKAIDGWIGAKSRQEAEKLIVKKHPAGLITSLYEKISGMWAYRVELAEDNDLDNATHESKDEVPFDLPENEEKQEE